MGYDKIVAISSWERVPERVLLLFLLLGGSLEGFLGIHLFHHKSVKISFRKRLWLMVALQTALVLTYISF